MILDKIKTNQKLEQILLNFIDVLRINILMVDTQGNSVLVPPLRGHGWNWTCKSGVLQYLGTPQFLSYFQKESNYLKHVDAFEFQTFAVPVLLQENEDPIGYLIVGPVILNKRLERYEYQVIARDSGADLYDLLESLNEIRIVTFNTLKSILDLLSDLSQYALKVIQVQEEEKTIYMTLLDLAMTLTQAECGSIMLFNKETKDLTIQVQRGLNPEKFHNVRVKLGEGIAGLAAQKKEPYVIHEGHASNRIRHLLKKPELKCALVLPIIKDNNEILGVMNISTRQETSRLATHSQQMLKTLTEITTNCLEY
ncbi:MAG: PocR ligand-binding domain-containing protein [Candidatus Omnitrophica bacterium]|nr:PocR ligand-binding domain-containing protein [Candidatus Omnitrophota bacterium]